MIFNLLNGLRTSTAVWEILIEFLCWEFFDKNVGKLLFRTARLSADRFFLIQLCRLMRCNHARTLSAQFHWRALRHRPRFAAWSWNSGTNQQPRCIENILFWVGRLMWPAHSMMFLSWILFCSYWNIEHFKSKSIHCVFSFFNILNIIRSQRTVGIRPTKKTPTSNFDQQNKIISKIYSIYLLTIQIESFLCLQLFKQKLFTNANPNQN